MQGPEHVLRELRHVRGLRNEDGQYNCFLNVIIQSLWHLRSFRDALLHLPASQLISSTSKSGTQSAGTAPASSDVRVMLALQNIFKALAQPVMPTRNDSTATSATDSLTDADGGSDWLVSPEELRAALSGLEKGAAAISIELTEMHDASEVLGEVFSALHRAEMGRAALPADDPQLPKRVKVRADGSTAASAHGAAPTMAHVVHNSLANGTSANGVSKTAAQPRSLVHRLFGLDVQVPAAAEDNDKTQQPAGVKASSNKRSSTAPPTATDKKPVLVKEAGMMEVQQYMKFFHLVPAQVGT